MEFYCLAVSKNGELEKQGMKTRGEWEYRNVCSYFHLSTFACLDVAVSRGCQWRATETLGPRLGGIMEGS